MRWAWAVALMLMAPWVTAAELRELRLWEGPEATRVVFDLDGDVKHALFTLSDPDRVVVDIEGLDQRALARLNAVTGKGVVARVRSAQRGDAMRVVFDVNQPVFATGFVLPPSADYGHRLVIDLASPQPTQPPAAGSAEQARGAPPRDETIVVAIDAGHGGEDPGARGPSGLLEKDAALRIARKLAKLINDTPNMRAVLTRDGDYYVGLRERVNIARKHQADLFVSIHCNAFTRRDMRGSAVYVLSERGATSEHARWLAQKENAADLVGGVHLQDKDHELAAVLIDLSQGATMEASFDVGSRILQSMAKINRLQKPDVQQAGFAVLKAPDIPSVLVETAFITNAEEERLLASGAFQASLAEQIFQGIKGYFHSYRPRQQTVEAEAEPQYVSRNALTSERLQAAEYPKGISR
ncbi:N-acetylmuramoyl-L-alanine amidase [Fontimonas thermophila]|uniref:N-acetylmuramoyl-L-alanine amidase AmiC n=1 Tax=Fontimonas thermophila TaxID=1076937 RepID=A0A1I2HLM0_9GAMM|nr:N-acetylmuramoyl-L-alanine amidase [Fontimonas thermophila]SFF30669.1 N-acetylmuramoyl-L-alanine amidase [Fontimonas thermophila]